MCFAGIAAKSSLMMLHFVRNVGQKPKNLMLQLVKKKISQQFRRRHSKRNREN